MTTDATVLVVAIVAGMLFAGGGMVVVGTLILLHYVVHTRRVSEQDACFKKIRELQSDLIFQKERVERMESLAASTVLRLAGMAEIIAKEIPSRGPALKDLVDSLIKLFHEQAPQSGIDIDANGDVTIGGSVIGRDKIKKVEYATS